MWNQFLAEPVVGLAPDDSEGCLVALGNGAVVAVDGSGEIQKSGGGESEATTVAWASSWPEGTLLVGRKDGTLELYG